METKGKRAERDAARHWYFWSDVGSHRCYCAISEARHWLGCHASDHRPVALTPDQTQYPSPSAVASASARPVEMRQNVAVACFAEIQRQRVFILQTGPTPVPQYQYQDIIGRGRVRVITDRIQRRCSQAMPETPNRNCRHVRKLTTGQIAQPEPTQYREALLSHSNTPETIKVAICSSWFDGGESLPLVQIHAELEYALLRAAV